MVEEVCSSRTMEEEIGDEEEHTERRWGDISHHDLAPFLSPLSPPLKGFTALPWCCRLYQAFSNWAFRGHLRCPTRVNYRVLALEIALSLEKRMKTEDWHLI